MSSEYKDPRSPSDLQIGLIVLVASILAFLPFLLMILESRKMSSEKEFDLDEWSKRDRNPYFDNGLLEMGRKEGFHKGQEQAAKRILEKLDRLEFRQLMHPVTDSIGRTTYAPVVSWHDVQKIIDKVLEESK